MEGLRRAQEHAGMGLTVDFVLGGASAEKNRNIDEALSLAHDEVVRTRVEKASICAYRAAIETCGTWKKVDGKRRLVALPPDLVDLVPKYIALCQRYHLTMTSEGGKAADYFKQLGPVLKR